MFFKRQRECEGCSELREELAKASRKLEGLVLDWEVQQDKVHRWMQRSSARARTEEQESTAPPVEKQLSGGNGIAHDPVSARLLARRSRRPNLPVADPPAAPSGEE